ncbi:conserved Plasmodium protein, unknown function [Plasmodium ovale wallikeri]|uniref:Ribosomal protein L25 n=1 Tax=Plasmodium ovale wallikeri TaxID=864142 RepID=A0A1A8YJJ7_PLAOA|nr:conserved Plasmodium protein, unknown function [Plasmodium ovale wallikeri]SBT31703.1 conserved Plasmodium protein, unknown function [Plasmodium ovale wallikeri]
MNDTLHATLRAKMLLKRGRKDKGKKKKMYLFKQISRKSYFMYNGQRNHFNYKLHLKFKQWNYLKKEIINYFQCNQNVSTTVDLKARCWEKFKKKELLQVHGYIPAIIWKYGEEKRICIDHKFIDEYAFEEEDGHLSLLSHVEADPGEETAEGKLIIIVGLIGCPAYINGYHVQLAQNFIKCKVIGNNIPPPFQIDVSRLAYKEPYNSIKLGELTVRRKDAHYLLPQDGNVIFSEEYDLNETEVVWTYEPGKVGYTEREVPKIPETPLPDDYVDPNFLNKRGKRIQLTYKDYWPKQ